MSVNTYLPHVLVLPEDEENSQIANGFQLGLDPGFSRQFQVLPLAGGWRMAVKLFECDLAASMRRYPQRIVVLLIDFDGDTARVHFVRGRIPSDLADRVFVLGALKEPKGLRNKIGPLEEIGQGLAKECREETRIIWEHDLLRHNAAELAGLAHRARSILFPSI